MRDLSVRMEDIAKRVGLGLPASLDEVVVSAENEGAGSVPGNCSVKLF
jgi:hypothetical protein